MYRINVVALDPLKNVVFKKNFMDIGLIDFDTSGPGEYTISFSSLGLKGITKEVLVMLHEDYLETPHPDYEYPDDWKYKDHHEKVKERDETASNKSTVSSSEPEITEEQAAILADQLEDADTV